MHGGPKSLELKEVGPRFEMRLYQVFLLLLGLLFNEAWFVGHCCYELCSSSYVVIIYYALFISLLVVITLSYGVCSWVPSCLYMMVRDICLFLHYFPAQYPSTYGEICMFIGWPLPLMAGDGLGSIQRSHFFIFYLRTSWEPWLQAFSFILCT